MDMTQQMETIAQRAKEAARLLGASTADERNAALAAMAQGLRDGSEAILSANARDVAAAQVAGVKASLVDRLLLDDQRLESMALALEELIALPDPVGCVREERELPNGLQLTKVSVPLGVVAVIYEARPNVTADAAGICLKSGNAAILRGGSLAAASNEALANILAEAARSAGLPDHAIQAVTTTDRAATDALMQLHGLIDVIVPRGGAGLIQHCVETSKVPVIETGTGNCHVYVHSSADLTQAADIVENAKCRRYGVCNAAETLLVDADIAPQALPLLLERLGEKWVTIHGDETVRAQGALLPVFAAGAEGAALLVSATEADWETEYLSPDIAVKVVSGVDEAIDHINRYGTGHSEAIVAQDEEAVSAFLARVDAAAVYANASTAFTDGGQIGLGAEIGISTQKLHVRGPFAAEALTSTKYLVRGQGHLFLGFLKKNPKLDLF